MQMYMCQWPGAGLSFVFARDVDDALARLSELQKEGKPKLTRIDHFLVDCLLGDSGELELDLLGNETTDYVWNNAFPSVFNAHYKAPTDDDGYLTPAGKEMMLMAVTKERNKKTIASGTNRR